MTTPRTTTPAEMLSVQALREAAEAALNAMDEWLSIPHLPSPIIRDLLRDTDQAANRLRTALAELADAEWADERDNRRDEHQCEGPPCCDDGDTMAPTGCPGREYK